VQSSPNDQYRNCKRRWIVWKTSLSPRRRSAKPLRKRWKPLSRISSPCRFVCSACFHTTTWSTRRSATSSSPTNWTRPSPNCRAIRQRGGLLISSDCFVLHLYATPTVEKIHTYTKKKKLTIIHAWTKRMFLLSCAPSFSVVFSVLVLLLFNILLYYYVQHGFLVRLTSPYIMNIIFHPVLHQFPFGSFGRGVLLLSASSFNSFYSQKFVPCGVF